MSGQRLCCEITIRNLFGGDDLNEATIDAVLTMHPDHPHTDAVRTQKALVMSRMSEAVEEQPDTLLTTHPDAPSGIVEHQDITASGTGIEIEPIVEQNRDPNTDSWG